MQFEIAKAHSDDAAGWLVPEEQHRLYRLAQEVPRGQAIAELGSWQGKSTIILAAGSASGTRAPVYAVDYFRPLGATEQIYSDALQSGESEYLSLFCRNLRNAGLFELVRIRQGGTVEQARRWDGPPIGLIFIDADHSYAAIKSDFLAWAPHCAPGAIVAFHDYAGERPSQVARFVDRLILSSTVTEAQVSASLLSGRLSTTSSRAIRCRLLGCPDVLPYAIRARLANRKLARGGVMATAEHV